MLLGCIADDFTGGTDLASALVARGIRTVQVIGVPEAGEEVVRSGAEAVVVALKTRTAPVADAVEQSLTALRWLREIGCEHYYFKYCSTFDSTPAGNIGPVAEALMDALGMDFTVVCPALPANGRTVRDGRLFVGDVPLDESPMRQHPLTPMDDANVVRLMRRQTHSRVGLVGHGTVGRGPERIRAEFDALRREGIRFAVVDATDDNDLLAIGRACADLPLVTASAGLAVGLAETFRAQPHRLTDGDPHAPVPTGGDGPSSRAVAQRRQMPRSRRCERCTRASWSIPSRSSEARTSSQRHYAGRGHFWGRARFCCTRRSRRGTSRRRSRGFPATSPHGSRTRSPRSLAASSIWGSAG
ncbi:hypothetical protein SVIO_028180 [Streptomyces violaceusniger]|uniref:Four-carbon acid sugar kinase N-terminal domain-containing protein n=1 Tax=Streptomyces violaceusniger TaxID=68280 RepID=A0A4D4KTC7_STRVO|nr:hypothetical protein SVIO_028180 [Streptomyces violaceusniger]